MIEILHSIGVFILLCMFIFAFGALVLRRDETASLGFCLVLGFLAFYTLSQLLLLPMVFTKQSLTTSSLLWAGVCVPLAVFSLIWNRKACVAMLRQALDFFKKPTLLAFLALALFLFQLVFIEGTWVVDLDDTYYTGIISTALYTDTIHQFEPYTGDALAQLNIRYALSMYPVVSAVLCQLFSLHPMLLTRLVLPALMLGISTLIFYEIAKEFFPKNRAASYLFLCFTSVLNLFGGFSIYMPSVFLLTRIGQGKSILSNILLPLLFLLCLRLYKNPLHKRTWLYLLMLSVGACTFTLTASFILPVALGAFVLPFCLWQKKPKMLLYFCVCGTAFALPVGVYFLFLQNIFTIPL